MTCPDLLLLSQLLDDELAAPEAAALRTHALACGSCREALARLERATTAARAASSAAEPAMPPGAPRSDCLGAERIAGWAGRALAGDDLRAADAHLERCDACLADALGALRTVATLDASPARALPAALRARVASRWESGAEAESLTALVLRITRTGLKLLERHVVAPVLEVEMLPALAPARRADEPADVVSFRIRAPDAQIRATVFPDGPAVGLTLSLVGSDDLALAGQRVYLRTHGRPIYSARTDAAGELRLPRITPGIYEVSCPGIATSFRLDLRP